MTEEEKDNVFWKYWNWLGRHKHVERDYIFGGEGVGGGGSKSSRKKPRSTKQPLSVLNNMLYESR